MKNKYDLPDSLKPLEELANNLWFSWNPDVRDLFREMDMNMWRNVDRNPVAFLAKVSRAKLNAASNDAAYLRKINDAYQRFKSYLDHPHRQFNNKYPSLTDQLVAYFSAEYGLHEAVPNYAGGLGILAGDHLKSASDLGVPLVAIGIMYKHAYFTQTINEKGDQDELYEELDTNQMPIHLVCDDKGDPVIVSVPIIDHDVFIRIWEVKVGRVSLFLLDTAVDENSEYDKQIIHSLYGGTRDTRMKQEIILGIGGLRALRRMGYNPTVFHLNEGHSAFLGFERLYELMNEGMNFNMALELVRSTTLFTTHTPIPAGNEAFEWEMMERYFNNFWPELEMPSSYFFDLGKNVNIHQHENFSLTVLALNLSYMANGVSQLHGEISRAMWQKVYPGIPTPESPIGHVTNGIHTETWLYRSMIGLFDEYMDKNWREHLSDEQYWDKFLDVPDDAFWEVRKITKKETMDHLRRRYEQRLKRYRSHNLPPVNEVLRDDILTIGFARRFAPYKRALLLFRDPERLKRILNYPDRPVQFLFSGKAHPNNEAGRELIRAINEYAEKDGFRGKIIFIEGYSINTARALVSGCDLWLNTPRRPMEACGTSGQKVPINGGINFSILDGWWCEGFNGRNGWTIGSDVEFPDHNYQDMVDGNSLYDALENEIIPKYYDRNENGIPVEWIKMSKESLRSVITRFSSHTMLWNYLRKYYVPGMKRSVKYSENEFAELLKFSRWQNRIKRSWKKVSIKIANHKASGEDVRIFSAGENKDICLHINLSGLKPEEMRVELILERQDALKGHQQMEIYPMGLVGKLAEDSYEYRANVRAKTNGSYRFNCRVYPTHQDFFNSHEMRLIKWLD
jgi:starch phosphorylase